MCRKLDILSTMATTPPPAEVRGQRVMTGSVSRFIINQTSLTGALTIKRHLLYIQRIYDVWLEVSFPTVHNTKTKQFQIGHL